MPRKKIFPTQTAILPCVMIRFLFSRQISLVASLLMWPPLFARAEDGVSRSEVYKNVAKLAAVGDKLFHDPRLSASGALSCASCHSEHAAFAPDNALSVQYGGVDMAQRGHRAVPSLKYLENVPQFTEHFFDSEDEADESIDNGPTGGLTWDGRANTLAEQAAIPLLAPFEMGRQTPQEVVNRAVRAGYGDTLRELGPYLHTTNLFVVITKALEAYQQDWRRFYPYSSKYDAYLAGKATLSPQERLGLKVFEDPEKGNCASCHKSQPGYDGTPPQFTDYGMIAVGVPRNRALPFNRNPNAFDLGLCGPDRTDLKQHADYCGLFRTPSLRNVATRHTFFHNGFYHSLRDAVAFYVLRDTHPEQIYPVGKDGKVLKYDDLPERYQENINMDPPFGPQPGNRPVLSDNEIDAIVAFLNTLTDGYSATQASDATQ
ncbi:cytochrome-c peroxidase [Acetobacter tropicalis]|nr:cytochrome c peroxidase [Acetobacter senegalensis]